MVQILGGLVQSKDKYFDADSLMSTTTTTQVIIFWRFSLLLCFCSPGNFVYILFESFLSIVMTWELCGINILIINHCENMFLDIT